MSIQLNKIKPGLYQKAFTFKYLGYLLSYYFLSNYRKIDFLIIYDKNFWRSFIPNATIKKTLREGRCIFADKRNFEKYHLGFKSALRECDRYKKKSEKLQGVTKMDWIELGKVIDKLYYYYEKTEFFFADAGYRNTNPMLEKNMKIVGRLKLEGRQRINDLLINALYRYAGLTAKQFGLNPEDLKFYNTQEVLRLQDRGIPVSQRIVQRRKRSYVLYCHDQKIIPLNLNQERFVLNRFKEKSLTKVLEFKGIVANKGKVQGKARVILANYQDDYRKFQHEVQAMRSGEILITETTSPEFVPAMRKAAGLITNQGGLGSHAAIVSRELGVPCVVGTQNATDIVRTGDIIELNANIGLVKILNKFSRKFERNFSKILKKSS